RRVRGALERVVAQRRQRPLHARRAHRVAHAPVRADDLDQRRFRSLPAARRADRSDPSRRPRVLRAGRGPLARRRADTVDDAHRHATGRRSGQRRHLGRARHRRGVRCSAGGRELMRATVMYEAGDVRIENVPDATIIEPTDAVVRVTRACICGSDLWPYKTMEPSDNGRVMGHEAIGVVEAVGADVRNIKQGDLVVMPFAFSDGTCVFCHEGLQTSCVHGGFFGTVDVPGAQAEAVRVPQADGTLVVLPVGEDDSLMPSLLTLADVMGTGHHAAVTANVGPVGVPQDETMPASQQAFYNNISISGGPAPVRAYAEELLPDILEGRIEPGRVFDRVIGLDDVPDGYRAMNDREAIKVIVTP